MFEMISAKKEPVSPDRAKGLLEMASPIYQRQLKQPHVDYLARCMERGTFRTGLIGITKNGDGMPIVMNGQHQCHAIIQSGVTIKATFERFVCPTPEDMSLLFRQYDPIIGARRLGDMLVVEARALGIDWPQKTLSLVIGAVVINHNLYALAADEKTERLRNHQKDGGFINTLLSKVKQKDSALLRRAPVAAAILRTWQKCQKDAENFWQQVRDGEMLKRNDPAYTLRSFLLLHQQFARGEKRVASQHEYLYRCIGSWNAFRKGQKQKTSKYYPEKPVPAAV